MKSQFLRVRFILIRHLYFSSEGCWWKLHEQIVIRSVYFFTYTNIHLIFGTIVRWRISIEALKKNNKFRCIGKKKKEDIRIDFENAYVFADRFIYTHTRTNTLITKQEIGAHFENKGWNIPARSLINTPTHTRKKNHYLHLKRKSKMSERERKKEKWTKKRKRTKKKRTSYSTVFGIMLLVEFITRRIVTNHFLHMWIGSMWMIGC